MECTSLYTSVFHHYQEKKNSSCSTSDTFVFFKFCDWVYSSLQILGEASAQFHFIASHGLSDIHEVHLSLNIVYRFLLQLHLLNYVYLKKWFFLSCTTVCTASINVCYSIWIPSLWSSFRLVLCDPITYLPFVICL